jgi:uncharacterized protein (TIGR02284 family)
METITSINSLIIINNDRFEGYKKAAEETEDQDLRSLFTRFSIQSKGWSEELRKFVPKDEEPGQDETTNSGKLYRAFMDVKAALTGKKRKTILQSCEHGEDVAKKTYDEVLEHTEGIPVEALNIVTRQRAELQQAHDEVKALRDAAI